MLLNWKSGPSFGEVFSTTKTLLHSEWSFIELSKCLVILYWQEKTHAFSWLGWKHLQHSLLLWTMLSCRGQFGLSGVSWCYELSILYKGTMGLFWKLYRSFEGWKSVHGRWVNAFLFYFNVGSLMDASTLWDQQNGAKVAWRKPLRIPNMIKCLPIPWTWLLRQYKLEIFFSVIDKRGKFGNHLSHWSSGPLLQERTLQL